MAAKLYTFLKIAFSLSYIYFYICIITAIYILFYLDFEFF